MGKKDEIHHGVEQAVDPGVRKQTGMKAHVYQATHLQMGKKYICSKIPFGISIKSFFETRRVRQLEENNQCPCELAVAIETNFVFLFHLILQIE